MSDDIIDRVVSESESETTADDSVEVVEVEETETEAVEESASTETEEPFPKKAKNAIRWRDKQISKLRAQNRELERYMQHVSAQEQEKSPPPDEASFETYADYLKARQDWGLETHFKERDQAAHMEQINHQKEAIRQQQIEIVAQRHDVLAKENPEYQRVMTENSSLISAIDQPELREIAEILHMIDDPHAAVFALAKEGILESVYSLPPAMAQMEIYHAQMRGAEYLAQTGSRKQKIVTGAPQPMVPAKGTGSVKKPVHELQGSDILKWMNT
jgi:hypothetical protein